MNVPTMGGRCLATLKDISRTLNLSVTQVSRALNDHSDVNEETRIRVKEAAKVLKYQPNINARKLARGRSGIVGLIVPYNPNMTSDGMWMEIVSGLSAQFSGRGMQFVLHIAQEKDAILSVYQNLISAGSLDGFVLVEPFAQDVRPAFLAQRAIPFVMHGRTQAPVDFPYFDIDNFGLAYQSTKRLIAGGHRRIALINGMQGRSYVEARSKGYRHALAEAGVPYQPSWLRHGNMQAATGMISTVEMFKEPKTGPTAIICANILIAKGVYQALEALALHVPADVSVIAHDDVLLGWSSNTFFPPLTVTRSPLGDSWEPLAEFLSGAIEGKPLVSLQRVAQCEFIQRASVGPAPA